MARGAWAETKDGERSARLAHSAHQQLLHVPQNWPWKPDWTSCFTHALHDPPSPPPDHPPPQGRSETNRGNAGQTGGSITPDRHARPAEINYDQHARSRARALDEDTLTRRRRILGADDPDTLTSASQLASDLYGSGDYPRARALQEETMSRRRRILGDDHTDTLTWVTHHGLLLWELGDYRPARELQNDAFARTRRVLGEDHPGTLRKASLLGLTLESYRLPARC